MADDRLLSIVEQHIERRFGHPIEDLYTRAANGAADQQLKRTLAWHHRLVATDALVKQHETVLLAHLVKGDELTPAETQEMDATAQRLRAVTDAREALAITVLDTCAPPTPAGTARAAAAHVGSPTAIRLHYGLPNPALPANPVPPAPTGGSRAR
ncbi:hypothetical protein [Streptomyces carpaticus]|uniref:hypothetical protein n=1 Tax=Streptomyces carpaticus TaxID=285558 RepID=UPI0031F89A53